MSRKFQIYPGEEAHTIAQLESLLNFKFLPRISFESETEELLVKQKGLDKLKGEGVSAQALELGSRYIDEIESGYIPHVSVRQIDAKVGHGLFAEEEIAAGVYVGEYTGIVRKNDRRYMQPLNDYCYEYPVPDEIGRHFVIDATQGNLTRFINHSYTPNLQPIHVFYDGFYHLIFLSLMPIAKGTQLSYNYGKNYWYLRSLPTIF